MFAQQNLYLYRDNNKHKEEDHIISGTDDDEDNQGNEPIVILDRANFFNLERTNDRFQG